MADDTKPDDQGGEPLVQERPDWLPDNFKEPEALAHAWREEQRKITEQGQELSQLREQNQMLAELATQRPAPSQDENPLIQQYARAYEEGDAATMLQVQAHVTQAMIQDALQQTQQQQQNPARDESMLAVYGDHAERALRQSYGDELFTQLEGRATELIQTGTVQITDPTTLGGVQSAMDTAFRYAASEKLFAQQRDEAKVAEQAAADRERKLAAQTAQGQGARPPAADAQEQVWAELVAAGQNRFRT